VKEIFSETKTVGEWQQKAYRPARPNALNHRCTVPAGVIEASTKMVARVVGHWDRKTGVLFVKPSLTAEYDDARPEWAPEGEPLLALISNQAAAQRWAIAFADEWYAKVAAAIPVPLSDEDVRAAWLIEHPQEPVR
jgi:hypothetical protein